MLAIQFANFNRLPGAGLSDRTAVGFAARDKGRGQAATAPGSDFDAVVSSLYEAAAMPQMWPHALRMLAEFTGGSGAAITRPDQGHRVVVSSPRLTANAPNDFEGGDRHGETQRGTVSELMASGPNALWFVACQLTSARTSTFRVSVRRSERRLHPCDQDVARLLRVEGHLRAALGLARTVALRTDDDLLDRLDQSQVAGFLLDHDGRVIAHNGFADLCLTSVISLQLGRLRTLDVRARGPLATLVDKACTRPRPGGGGTLAPLRLASASGAVMLALASPLSDTLQPLSESRALLTLAPMRSAGADAETLTAAFGLTRAEARVAQLISQGRDLPAIAEALALSLGAVRFHLKSILPKAGVGRQAAFVALAASLGHRVAISADAAPRPRQWPELGLFPGRPETASEALVGSRDAMR